ncbi:MAG: hypothetical protein AAGK97_12010 [Bacteroidota bacterium]
MASINQAKIDPFDPKKIKLDVWLSMLEAHFAHANITEPERKKNCLLVCLGSDSYSVLSCLCAPLLPHEVGYDELVNALKSHFIVKASYHRALIKFQQRKKLKSETLRDLYADLKGLAKDCSFGAAFDSRVRDQLFMAIDQEIYFPNLSAENLDLQTMTSAATLERILNFEKAFCSERSVSSITNEVNAVHFNSKNDRGCKHCGYPHRDENCKFKHLTCSNCNIRGHLRRVCKKLSGQDPSSKFGNRGQGLDSGKPNSVTNQSFDLAKREGKFKKKVNAIAEVSNCLSDSDSDHLLELRDCSENDKQNVVGLNFIHPVINTNIKLTLKDIDCNFEVDSGATVSTISLDTAQRLQIPVQDCSKRLKAYGNVDVNVLGQIYTNVTYNEYST